MLRCSRDLSYHTSKRQSTLLKVLAESCCKDVTVVNDGVVYTGSVTSPRDVRVAFVEQEPPMPSDITVGDALLGIVSSQDISSETNSASIYQTVRRYRLAVKEATDNPQEFASASAAMDACGGWNVLTKAQEVATRLRVRHLEDKPLSNLSGGERKRVALAAALVQDPDVLLLGELITENLYQPLSLYLNSMWLYFRSCY